jgi:hypothetical protein
MSYGVWTTVTVSRHVAQTIKQTFQKKYINIRHKVTLPKYMDCLTLEVLCCNVHVLVPVFLAPISNFMFKPVRPHQIQLNFA